MEQAPIAAGPLEALVGRLTLAQVGACTCMTKTPEPQHHDAECHYRLLIEAAEAIHTLRANAARWDAIETLMILGDVELTQAEDGGYSIYVEPVENIVPTYWEGGTPEEAANKVVAQLTTPNVQGQGRCAALSRSVPCTAGLGLATSVARPSVSPQILVLYDA